VTLAPPDYQRGQRVTVLVPEKPTWGGWLLVAHRQANSRGGHILRKGHECHIRNPDFLELYYLRSVS
jgi:hypothetical protein